MNLDLNAAAADLAAADRAAAAATAYANLQGSRYREAKAAAAFLEAKRSADDSYTAFCENASASTEAAAYSASCLAASVAAYAEAADVYASESRATANAMTAWVEAGKGVNGRTETN